MHLGEIAALFNALYVFIEIRYLAHLRKTGYFCTKNNEDMSVNMLLQYLS